MNQSNISNMSTGGDQDEDLFLIITIFAAAFWYNSLRNRSKLTRCAILKPSMSPWVQLLNYGDESSFLEMNGFSREAFYTLKNVLFSVDRNDRRLGGRPRSLDESGELGLYSMLVHK
jgi:hypothetical protein